MHQRMNRQLKKMEEISNLVPIVEQVREDHPRMSLRSIYRMIQPQTMGRDAFEKEFSEMGYSVRMERNYRRTTDSTGVIRFDNLIEDRELNGINQVWVSDITYYEMNQKFYYLTFVTDRYSRKILGACESKTLRTKHTTIPALNGALRTRKGTRVEGAILHSDGGGQYYSKEFLSLTTSVGLLNSMGKSVYENPHAERLNGIIKNNYIKPYNPTNERELKQALEKAVRMYNSQKPHSALGGLSPDNYEQVINNLPVVNKEKRTKKENYNSSNNNSNSLHKTVNAI